MTTPDQMQVDARGAVSFRAITVVQPALPITSTAGFFDKAHSETVISPIDQFIENANSLNRLYLNLEPFPPEMGSLVLLGYVSAVESFLRALFRGIINVDEHAARLVEPMSVPFGAALFMKLNVLPEAVLEEYSFSSAKSVKEAIRELIGIKGNLPRDLELVLAEFQKVCEIRHCCVHRFGRLGAKNAIRLGLVDHSEVMEKPLKLSQSAIGEIAINLRNLVKVINNFVFGELMMRSAMNKAGDKGIKPYLNEWTWKWPSDRRRFMRYYILFASGKDAAPSAGAKEVYETLRSFARESKAKSVKKI